MDSTRGIQSFLTLVLGGALCLTAGEDQRMGMLGPAISPPDSTSAASSPLIRVALLGNWVKPREAELTPEATVWEAAMAAGGPIQWPPSMVHIMRKDTLLLQVNLAHDLVKKARLGSLGLQSGDVMYHGFPPPPPGPPPATSKSAVIKEGLNITIQVLAILSSLLFTYSTYSMLHDQGKL